MASQLNVPYLHHHRTAGLMICPERFKYLHILKPQLFYFQPIITKVFNPLPSPPLFLAITVSPLSRALRSQHLCLVWEGLNEPYASP